VDSQQFVCSSPRVFCFQDRSSVSKVDSQYTDAYKTNEIDLAAVHGRRHARGTANARPSPCHAAGSK